MIERARQDGCIDNRGDDAMRDNGRRSAMERMLCNERQWKKKCNGENAMQ